MKAFIYTALRAVITSDNQTQADIEGHITTSFTEVNRKLPKIYPSKVNVIAAVGNVVYWPDAKVTVALIEDEYAIDRLNQIHSSLMAVGLDYQYAFTPHITLSYGEDETEKYRSLVGCTVYICGDYVGTVVKQDGE